MELQNLNHEFGVNQFRLKLLTIRKKKDCVEYIFLLTTLFLTKEGFIYRKKGNGDIVFDPKLPIYVSEAEVVQSINREEALGRYTKR